MSWDSYLDNMKGQAQNEMEGGAIIGLDGSLWTSSAHALQLPITQEEASKLASCIKSRDYDPFRQHGTNIGGVKYQFLRSEDGDVPTLRFKKKENGALSIAVSKTAIVICKCPEGGQQANSNTGSEKIAEYLCSMNM